MQYDVFISYSRKDTEIANQICKAFDEVGITYFIDRQGISGGFEFPTVLAEAIVNCKIFLYIASQNSYESRFTQSEITFAFNEKPKGSILPYIIDGSTMPPALRFVFSNINWRRLEEHPINTVLVDDLLNLLGKKRMPKQNPQQKKHATSIETSNKAPTPSSTNKHKDHKYVDLGLSVKWATCNVGASSPEDYGDYFAWGETETKEVYIETTYMPAKKILGIKCYIDTSKNISGTQYDAAHAKWGGNWRMPTFNEIKELKEKCSWRWTEINGVYGYLVIGSTGNSIFLPAAGYRVGKDTDWRGTIGYYWSAPLHEYDTKSTLFNFGGMPWRSCNDCRYIGRPIRPVLSGV